MRALVLNLATATDRLKFMGQQLDALGISWERIEAVTPATLSPPASDRVWHGWERPLRTTEMATCATHIAAWMRIRDLDTPCLVLEDDALLDSGVPALLAALDYEKTGFDHLSLETRGRRKLVDRTPHPDLPIRRLRLDRTGAAAYVLWRSGARKLLARADRARGLADGMICAAFELDSWQADPALAIQLDRCAAHGLTPPLVTASQIDAAPKPDRGGASFRIRRLAAQLAMGLRQLRPGTERREIPPAGNWIEAVAGHSER